MRAIDDEIKDKQKQSVSGSGLERATYSVKEATEILGIGLSTGYLPGVLPTIKVGGRLLVPRAALQRLIDSAEPIPAK